MNVTLSKIAHPDFIILSDQKISKAFLKIKVNNFFEACLHVGAWPYFRNKDKSNLLAMFNEQCGTCSNKHALLKELANENNFNDLQLMLGIFKMNERNTPKIKGILKNYHLDHIPEAHCYLRYKNQILDFTNINAKPIHFLDDLLFETEIQVTDIMENKIALHKKYLQQWLNENPELPYDLQAIWQIREQCIEELSK